MYAWRSCIAKMDVLMDFQLSLSLPPEPALAEPSLAEGPPLMPLPLEAIYNFKEELYTLIQA
jgi:hypothetical protein